MPQVIKSRSDMLEEKFTVDLWRVIWAAVLFLLLLLGLYLSHFILGAQLRYGLYIILGAALIADLVWLVMGAMDMQKARNVQSVTVPCPYCDFPMEFLEPPTSDYDCESCHRRVQYENGKPVPIKIITCAFCQTVHKVSAKTKQFTCDRCNRALKLTDPNDPTKVVAERSDILQNYDVVLTDIGRKPTDVAMALESILICNLVEARRQMENLPLTVMRNVPERKADAVRRRLRDLGATAVIRVTAEQ